MSRRARSSLLLPFGLFGAFAGVAGCQSIAGIEERTLDTRAVQCSEYCSTVMANCTDDNAVFTTELQCMNVCRALDPGSETEPTGNTVACRQRRAEAAEREPAASCPQAGPGGNGGPCGSDCEAWCTLLEEACPGEFQKINDDCVSTCESTLTDQDDFHLERDYGGDTIECRLVHTAVAFVEDPAVHCSHAGFIPDSMCISASEEPSCEVMCNNALGICQGERAVWENEDQCLAACAVFELGTAADTLHPTVACRNYHALTAALDDPDFHCPHAGPTGEGMCGPGDADVSGPCQSYCLLLDAACADHVPEGLDLGGDSLREFCESDCMTELANKGASPANPGYSLDRSESGDTLMCRARHAVRALSDPDECPAAFGGAPCN